MPLRMKASPPVLPDPAVEAAARPDLRQARRTRRPRPSACQIGLVAAPRARRRWLQSKAREWPLDRDSQATGDPPPANPPSPLPPTTRPLPGASDKVVARD